MKRPQVEKLLHQFRWCKDKEVYAGECILDLCKYILYLEKESRQPDDSADSVKNNAHRRCPACGQKIDMQGYCF